MTQQSRNTADAVDGLLEHAQAQSKALSKLENVVWFATDLLLEADRLYRAYGVDHIPSDEAQQFVAGIRHYLLIAPALPPRPETPDAADRTGKASAASGLDIDISVEEDVARAVADLTEGDAA